MKVKKALPLCLFLSLLMTTQTAHAYWLLRFLGIGSRAASTTVRAGSSAAKLSRSTSLMKGLGKEALIAGAVGVAANELYDSYQLNSGSSSETLSIQDHVANQNHQSIISEKEPFSRSITIKLGDPDLVW